MALDRQAGQLLLRCNFAQGILFQHREFLELLKEVTICLFYHLYCMQSPSQLLSLRLNVLVDLEVAEGDSKLLDSLLCVLYGLVDPFDDVLVLEEELLGQIQHPYLCNGSG